jgi:hypothetical protein
MCVGGLKNQIEDHKIVAERELGNLGNQSSSEEKDTARTSWLQWLASKSKLTTEKPNTISTGKIETATSVNRKDPLLSLLSSKLKFPGNYLF